LRFENYLHQENIGTYIYEPFGSINLGQKNPDYLVNNGKSALVEVKEIESIPLDHVVGAGSMDAMGVANIMRKKIYEASKQLESHIGKTNFSIILLGKSKGFDLHLLDLEWAMYGDPVIRVPINLTKGSPRGSAYSDMKVKGAMRKNHPITKQMYFPSNYINAVGIIKEVNGYAYFMDKLYQKYSSPYNKKESPDSQIEIAYKEYELIKTKYECTIPHEFLQNQEAKIFRIELIANALSKYPLPKSFFASKYNLYKIHKVIHK